MRWVSGWGFWWRRSGVWGVCEAVTVAGSSDYFSGYEVVEGEPVQALKTAVAAAEGSADHADAAAGAGGNLLAERVEFCDDIGEGDAGADGEGVAFDVDLDGFEVCGFDEDEVGCVCPVGPEMARVLD